MADLQQLSRTCIMIALENMKFLHVARRGRASKLEVEAHRDRKRHQERRGGRERRKKGGIERARGSDSFSREAWERHQIDGLK